MPTVAIRAQHAALLHLRDEVGLAAEHSDGTYLAYLVSQVVEFEHDGIGLA